MYIKKLDPRAKIPVKATPGSAGRDLHALLNEDVEIRPGETVLIRTGLAMEIPTGYVGKIYARSGLAIKRGIRLANSVAIIDSDYRGEIFVPLHNDSSEPVTISDSERIAQIIFSSVADLPVSIKEELEDTVRGTGGFGSTGM